MTRVKRPLKLTIRCTADERALWDEAAAEEATAIWARQILNAAVRDLKPRGARLPVSAPGAGDAALAPTPEDREIEGRPGLVMAAPGSESGSPLDEADPFVIPPSFDTGPFDPACLAASRHWLLARGDPCPVCGGMGR